MDTREAPSAHLNWSELDCHDGTEYPFSYTTDVSRLPNLIEGFEALRNKLGPLQVLSCYRTPDYNRKIGGAPSSQHIQGRAIDIRTPKDLTPRELFDVILALANSTPIRGIGLYKWGCHMDVRPQTRLSIWRDKGIGEI